LAGAVGLLLDAIELLGVERGARWILRLGRGGRAQGVELGADRGAGLEAPADEHGAGGEDGGGGDGARELMQERGGLAAARARRGAAGQGPNLLLSAQPSNFQA
jgi:hypothetical protein